MAAWEKVGTYTFQASFLRYGIIAGLLLGVALLSVPAGLSALVLFAVVGAVWRKGEPALAWCLAFQWLFVGVPYAYYRLTGVPPVPGVEGNLTRALGYSLGGLVLLTLGLRVGIRLSDFLLRPVAVAKPNHTLPLSIRRLLLCIVILGAFDWLSLSDPFVWRSGAQILQRFFDLKYLAFLLLLFEVVKSRRNLAAAIFAFIYLLVPSLVSYFASFKLPLFCVLFVLLSEWRPWLRLRALRLHNRRLVWAAVCLAALIVVSGAVWQGVVKWNLRRSFADGKVTGSAIERVLTVVGSASESLQDTDASKAMVALVERLSGGISFFGIVSDRVPKLLPHSGGEYSLRTLKHITQPRILFPNKEVLGSDSSITNKYTGLRVAGAESGTSIGIGYMAQLYIDFGVPGMFVALAVIGMIVGVCYRIPLAFSPSYDVYRVTAAFVMLQNFTGYETDLAKMLGGVIQSTIIFSGLLCVFGVSMIRFLTAPSSSSGKSVRNRLRSRPRDAEV